MTYAYFTFECVVFFLLTSDTIDSLCLVYLMLRTTKRICKDLNNRYRSLNTI